VHGWGGKKKTAFCLVLRENQWKACSEDDETKEYTPQLTDLLIGNLNRQGTREENFGRDLSFKLWKRGVERTGRTPIHRHSQRGGTESKSVTRPGKS